MTGQLLAAALGYAARGWHVFPLLPGSKRPACPDHPAARCDRTDPWCRAGHTGWEQRATLDVDRIRRAWSSRPYGIAIACGPSELLVVDTDRPKRGDPVPPRWATDGIATGTTGEEVLAHLAASHGERLPLTLKVTTPSGGVHRYYRTPAGTRLGNSAGRLGRLIDTRGRGGYVIAPPTELHRPYRLDDDRTPTTLPPWLTQLLTRPTRTGRTAATDPQRPAVRTPAGGATTGYARAAVAGETAHVEAAAPGRRNHTLFCAAVALGQLVAGGQLDEHTARLALRKASVRHIDDGAFTTVEADATITSGLARGAGEPRTGPERTAT